MASTDRNDWVLDPFCGSGTTGIAANLCGRRFAGIEQEQDFCDMARARRQELENIDKRGMLLRHLEDLRFGQMTEGVSESENVCAEFPFLVKKRGGKVGAGHRTNADKTLRCPAKGDD